MKAILFIILFCYACKDFSGQPNLFISEYVEGTFRNQAIEIYNNTDQDIVCDGTDLSIWWHRTDGSGATGTFISGTIYAHDVFVVTRADAAAGLLSYADQTSIWLTFDGKVAITLEYDDGIGQRDILDIIGQIYGYTGPWGSAPTSTQDQTLRRKPEITIGDRDGNDAFDPADEWDGYPIDTFNGLGNHVLPVELTSFTAAITAGVVQLNWETATELNNFGFEVERKSFDAEASSLCHYDWEKIGFVKGSGTSSHPQFYQFRDEFVLNEKFSSAKYRLKQIDFDGSFSYSEEVEVKAEAGEMPAEFELYQNYPNPFNPTSTICWQLEADSKVQLKIYDVLGREAAVLVDEFQSAGFHRVTLDSYKYNLASGVYFYKLYTESLHITKKMLLLR